MEIDLQNLQQLVPTLALATLLAILLGFFAARSYYRNYRVLQISILNQEIMRLRRRLSGEQVLISHARRSNDRLKRKSKVIVGLD